MPLVRAPLLRDAPPLPCVVGPHLPAKKDGFKKRVTAESREERTSRFRFCDGVSSGSTADVDWRSLADDLRGACCSVLFSFFIGWTGLAFGFCCCLGLADTLALSATDAEAPLRSSCSMRARLRAMFASRSSSLRER